MRAGGFRVECGHTGVMNPRIIGTVMPVLEISMDPGESVVAESGQLSWMTDSIRLRTSTGGVLGAVKRALAGAGLFMTEYSASRHPGMVAFAAKLPGQIVPVPMHRGGDYMV